MPTGPKHPSREDIHKCHPAHSHPAHSPLIGHVSLRNTWIHAGLHRRRGHGGHRFVGLRTTGRAHHLRPTINWRDVPRALNGGNVQRTSAPLQVPGLTEGGRLPRFRGTQAAPHPRVHQRADSSGCCSSKQREASEAVPCACRWARCASLMRISIRSARRKFVSQSSPRRIARAEASRSPETHSILPK